MKLIERKPQRLFAFGCSFTHYGWSTWPDVIAHDLDIPMYNLGRAGAGNQYIANMVAQANEHYGFTKDDLVMICWSGYLREDRWFDGGWQTNGDISTYSFYDKNFVDNYVDPVGCFIRDFASFSLTKRLLEQIECQHHMFSMAPLWQPEQDHSIADPGITQTTHKLKKIYGRVLSAMLGNYMDVLWQGKMDYHKLHEQHIMWQNKYTDWHPHPREHLYFLEKIFNDHVFKSDTIHTVEQTQKTFENFIRTNIDKLGGEIFDTIKLPLHEHRAMHSLLHFRENLADEQTLIR